MIASPLSLSLSPPHGLIHYRWIISSLIIGPRTSLWTGLVIETINSDRTVYFDRLQRLDVTEFGWKNLRNGSFYCYLEEQRGINEFLLIIY